MGVVWPQGIGTGTGTGYGNCMAWQGRARREWAGMGHVFMVFFVLLILSNLCFYFVLLLLLVLHLLHRINHTFGHTVNRFRLCESRILFSRHSCLSFLFFSCPFFLPSLSGAPNNKQASKQGIKRSFLRRAQAQAGQRLDGGQKQYQISLSLLTS